MCVCVWYLYRWVGVCSAVISRLSVFLLISLSLSLSLSRYVLMSLALSLSDKTGQSTDCDDVTQCVQGVDSLCTLCEGMCVCVCVCVCVCGFYTLYIYVKRL